MISPKVKRPERCDSFGGCQKKTAKSDLDKLTSDRESAAPKKMSLSLARMFMDMARDLRLDRFDDNQFPGPE